MSRTPVAFDSSIYIPYLRGEAYSDLIESAVRSGGARLSVVVLAELYAGTRSRQDKSDLDLVRQGFESIGGLVTPAADDWTTAGQAIRRYTRLYGTIDPHQHLNDLLIGISVSRRGFEVVTEDSILLGRWAGLLRGMGAPVRIRHVIRGDHLD